MYAVTLARESYRGEVNNCTMNVSGCKLLLIWFNLSREEKGLTILVLI